MLLFISLLPFVRALTFCVIAENNRGRMELRGFTQWGLATKRRVVKWTVKKQAESFSSPGSILIQALVSAIPHLQLSAPTVLLKMHWHVILLGRKYEHGSHCTCLFAGFFVIYFTLLYVFKMKERWWEQPETLALCFLVEPQTASLWKW